jgi:hypothetical protein
MSLFGPGKSVLIKLPKYQIISLPLCTLKNKTRLTALSLKIEKEGKIENEQREREE